MDNHRKRFEKQFCLKLDTCAGLRDLLAKTKSFKNSELSLMYKLQDQGLRCGGDQKKHERRHDKLLKC